MPEGPIRLDELAAELGLELEGDGGVRIGGVAALESAGPGDLSFVRSERYGELLRATGAGAVIAPPGLDTGGRPALRSAHPGLDFARAVRRIAPPAAPPAGVHESAWVAAGAHVDASACVGAGCVVAGGAHIGPGTVLYPRVVVGESARLGADCVVHAACVIGSGSVVGDRVVLQPGVVLGADGFGYVPDEGGRPQKMPQVGRVVVGDDVEIGANSTVDRGTLGETRIGRGTKIDNLVHVGHNCAIGEGVIIAAQCGLSGSVVVEDGALLMGQAGVSDHLRIGARAFVGPQCGVHRDVPPGTRVMGTPWRAGRSWHRIEASLTRLPSLFRRLRALERELGLRGREPKP